MRKKYENTLLKNKAMNNDVYKLRRQVIALIHEASKLVDLPRINVRIAENDTNIAGVARMGKNTIWITEQFVASRGLVFHEIVHAVFGLEHIPGCPLMAGDGSSLSISQVECDRLFLKYAKLKGFKAVKKDKAETCILVAS
jgi:hypothetical protein